MPVVRSYRPGKGVVTRNIPDRPIVNSRRSWGKPGELRVNLANNRLEVRDRRGRLREVYLHRGR